MVLPFFMLEIIEELKGTEGLNFNHFILLEIKGINGVRLD